MAYDAKFYERYRNYLKEPSVRKSHDHVFELFASLVYPNSPSVIDLGCGLGEYAEYDKRHAGYWGVDANNAGGVPNFILADYMGLDLKTLVPFPMINAFISVFSIECCLSPQKRYDFYQKVFLRYPRIQFGLVAGFFYESKRDKETVEETGGIISYQTIENPALFLSDVFTELRLHIRTPSQMFSDDVIEVWKIFKRR